MYQKLLFPASYILTSTKLHYRARFISAHKISVHFMSLHDRKEVKGTNELLRGVFL